MPTSHEVSSYLCNPEGSNPHALEISKAYSFLAANAQNTHDSSLAFACLGVEILHEKSSQPKEEPKHSPQDKNKSSKQMHRPDIGTYK
jgi:hypothetical protein